MLKEDEVEMAATSKKKAALAAASAAAASTDFESLNSKLKKLSLQRESGDESGIQSGAAVDSGIVSPDAKNHNNIHNNNINNDIGFEEPQNSTPDSLLSECKSRRESGQTANGGIESESGDGKKALSDSGQGSEADDADSSSNNNNNNSTEVMIYTFNIRNAICGKFIGMNGNCVKELKSASKCQVRLRNPEDNNNNSNSNSLNAKKKAYQHYREDPNGLQIAELQGTRAQIDKCLELIRKKFPLDKYPDLDLEQTNSPVIAAAAAAAASGGYFSEDNYYFGEASLSPQVALNQIGVLGGRPVQVSKL